MESVPSYSRKSAFSIEVEKAFMEKVIILPHPQVGDLLTCQKRACLSRGVEVRKEEEEWKLQYKSRLLDTNFSISTATIVLSDDNDYITVLIDAVISYAGEKSIVKFFRDGGNLHIDEQETIACMYLSGIWNAVMIHVRDDGGITSCLSVSPQVKEGYAILREILRLARETMLISISSGEKKAVIGKHCHGCRFSDMCIEYMAREADSERDEIRHRSEERE